MEARRGGRPSQVRPRPSSPGTRGRIRPASPSPNRLSRHRSLERRRGLPLIAKLGFAGGVIVLGVWLTRRPRVVPARFRPGPALGA